MSEQQTTDEQPQKRQRHGLTPAKKAIRKYGTGALDQRTGPDLDVYVYETEFDGICDFQGATENKPESFSCSLEAGDYVVRVNDYWANYWGGTGNPSRVSYRLIIDQH